MTFIILRACRAADDDFARPFRFYLSSHALRLFYKKMTMTMRDDDKALMTKRDDDDMTILKR